MKQDQKGFTIVEVLLVILLIGLIIGGLFLFFKARNNLSHSKSDTEAATLSEINNEREQEIEGSATAYTGQLECHQDEGDDFSSPAKNKGTGIYVGVEHKSRQATGTTNEVTSDLATDGVLKTSKNTYPLIFDAENSYMAVNRSAIIFNFITTDKATSIELTGTKATASYKIRGQSYTTPEFTISSCVV